MSWKDTFFRALGKINPRYLAMAEKGLKAIPGVNQRIEDEYSEIMAELEGSAKPYKNKFITFTQIPEVGRNPVDVLREMEDMRDQEESHWKDGFVSGAVYHGD